jgi:hypothetical protein
MTAFELSFPTIGVLHYLGTTDAQNKIKPSIDCEGSARLTHLICPNSTPLAIFIKRQRPAGLKPEAARLNPLVHYLYTTKAHWDE